MSSQLNDCFCICILKVYKQLSLCGGIAEDIAIEHNGFSHSCQIDNQGNAQRVYWLHPFPLSCARDFQESAAVIYSYCDWIPWLLLTEKSEYDASLTIRHHWWENRYRLDWKIDVLSPLMPLTCLSFFLRPRTKNSRNLIHPCPLIFDVTVYGSSIPTYLNHWLIVWIRSIT